jgi:hypothetical protein
MSVLLNLIVYYFGYYFFFNRWIDFRRLDMKITISELDELMLSVAIYAPNKVKFTSKL